MLKSITLHRAAHDNAGNYLDAGTEVTVGDGKAHIDAARAQDLVSSHGAQGHHATADKAGKARPKPKAKKSPPRPAPAPEPAPAEPAPAFEPDAG